MAQSCIAIVCGTRADAVRLAPVYRALRALQRFEVLWIQTGRDAHMARDLLRCFDITPHSLVAHTGASSAKLLSRCAARLDVRYAGVPVLQTKAGLRTLHFAPTSRAKAALLVEGVEGDRIVVTGSTVIDAQRWSCARYGIAREAAQAGHVLVAVHQREEDSGSELGQVLRAVADIAAAHPQRRILIPVHLDPILGRLAQAILGRLPNVSLLPPLDYLAMQYTLANADLLLTDSGCLQEEASTFGVPTIVLWRGAERAEAVEAGCVLLAAGGHGEIAATATRLLREGRTADELRKARSPFGNGRAAERIAECVRRTLDM
jgi:UDP-N-acetylglucosamine 2-epimerase (non-hydrolysing)